MRFGDVLADTGRQPFHRARLWMSGNGCCPVQPRSLIRSGEKDAGLQHHVESCHLPQNKAAIWLQDCPDILPESYCGIFFPVDIPVLCSTYSWVEHTSCWLAVGTGSKPALCCIIATADAGCSQPSQYCSSSPLSLPPSVGIHTGASVISLLIRCKADRS